MLAGWQGTQLTLSRRLSIWITEVLLNSRERYLEQASKRYHAQFRDPASVDHSAVKSGRQYLSDHGIRGSKQGLIADKYRLGVVIDPILPEDKHHAGMLAIPYLTPSGVKAIKFRRLDGGKPKYAAPKSQPVRLFNTPAYFSAGTVIGLAEGEIDAIVATEVLGIPTMGIPGAENWIAHGKIWTPLFKDFRDVLVFKDGDPEQVRLRNGIEVKFRPGDELANAIVASLKTKVRVIECPEGEDVSSMVAAGRIDELTSQFSEVEQDDYELAA